ncbi:MAG TPA: aquaporin [Fimbriimonadaceae bacterium]|nr:aquaporin [Fimbriimonadaceae bacterium]
MKNALRLRNLLSEFIGTFALLFVGVGSIAGDQLLLPGSKIGVLGIALAHGITIAVMASALGPISGGHFNPAVTMGAWVGRRIDALSALAYIVVQVLGALAGVFMVGATFDPNSVQAVQSGLPVVAPVMDGTRAVLAEGMFTFFLVAVIFGTAFFRWAPKIGGLYIGLTVFLAGLVIGPLTGGSINPARWAGPAIATGDYSNLAVYLAGPVLGAIVAAGIFGYILERRDEVIEALDEVDAVPPGETTV